MKVWDSVKRLFHPSSMESNDITTPSSSYFPPNVTLQDWWLTSLKTDDGRAAIGVQGITAPIYQDWYGVPLESEMEKKDKFRNVLWITVGLVALMNQAERCFTSAPILKRFDYHGLETVDGIHIILDGNINKNQTLENGFPDKVFDHFKIGFPRHWEEFVVDTGVQSVSLPLQDCDIFSVNIGVQGHDHTVFSNETITVPDASSIEVPHEDITEAGHGVLCERSPLTSDIEDDPSFRMSHLNIDVHDMKHNITRNDLAAISKCSGASGSKSRSLLQKIANLDKVTLIDPEKLNHDEQNLENISLNLSVACEQDSNEAANCSQDMDNRFTINGKQNDKDLEVRRKKLSLEVGISNQGKNEDADVHGESQVATRKGDREAKFSKAKFSDPSSCASVGNGFLVNASSDTAASCRVDYQDTIMTRTKSKRKLTSGSSARRQLIAISPKSARTISKAEKKKKRKGRSSSPYSEGTCNAAAAVRQGMDSQEAIKTLRKSKRNLTSESLAERKLIAISPESAKTISKAKKGSKVIILSPESFGGRKSRSGRVLLPRLEFWRNQKVLYDPDRKVCGIEEHM
ncbi:SANT associated [Artemisia annua]|uniref:SANT associated n=1 Tax=Artemisia annua TaxID=35608 RepID=A0A2U1PJ20_ARTAN|nr:SANT associated [Artemisia annua]